MPKPLARTVWERLTERRRREPPSLAARASRQSEQGDAAALEQRIELLAEQGDLGELRRLADQGNPTATARLITVAFEQGNLDELQRLADLGNRAARDQLIELAE